jgi:hypothetical protein
LVTAWPRCDEKQTMRINVSGGPIDMTDLNAFASALTGLP